MIKLCCILLHRSSFCLKLWNLRKVSCLKWSGKYFFPMLSFHLFPGHNTISSFPLSLHLEMLPPNWSMFSQLDCNNLHLAIIQNIFEIKTRSTVVSQSMKSSGCIFPSNSGMSNYISQPHYMFLRWRGWGGVLSPEEWLGTQWNGFSSSSLLTASDSELWYLRPCPSFS